MNLPFLNQSKQQNNPKKPNDWTSKLDELLNGKSDPKQTALELVSKLNPLQKAILKKSLPAFQMFVSKNGANDNSIQQFLAEIKTKL